MADLAIMSFNAGVLSPLLDGRSDLEKYYSGLRVGENMVPLPYGPAERRPGTYFVCECKNNDKKARLIPFQYSTEQAYILEYGDQYIRFYKDRGQIVTGTGTEDLSGIGDIIGHWKLNDNTDNTAVDGGTCSIGGCGDHDGVATSNTEDLHQTGKVGTGCFDFNGVDAVEINDDDHLSFGNGTVDSPFSIKAWIYVKHTGSGQGILTKWDDNNIREWRLIFNADNKLRFQIHDESAAGVGPHIISDDVIPEGWHMVVATYAGQAAAGATAADLMTLYVDGEVVDSTATNNATYDAMENLGAKVCIGNWYSNTNLRSTVYFTDKMDNVALFNKELSAAEVALLWSIDAYEISSSYLEADLVGLQRAQSADVLFNAHGNYAPSKLMRYAHDDWELADIVFDWPPFLEENDTDITITPTGAGAAPLAVGTAVTLTASAAIFTSDHVDSYWLIKHPRTADDTVEKNVQRNAYAAAGDGTELKDVKGSGHMRTEGSWTGRIVIERSYDEGTTWHTLGDAYESLAAAGQNFNVSFNEEEGNAWYRTRALEIGGGTTCIANLSIERYYHYGIVKVTAFTSTTVVTGEVVRAINSESATKLWSEGAWSGERGYPVTSAFFEGRLFYAGTSYRPLNIWGSVVNAYDNMDTGNKLADDAVKYTVDASMQNMIRWLVGHEVLLIGTSGGEWRLGSVDPADAITPTNPMKPKEQTTYGSKEIQALLLANAVLFVDAQGRRVRGAQYIFEKGEAGGYDAPDYTMLAEHITESGIVGMAYQQNPYPILWCWRDDGKMIGMVFEPGQKVWGWFPLDMDGDVESVAVIPGVTEDEVWIIVKREINGETKRYIEYFKPRDWGDDQADCFFVDSGLTFDGGAAVTITGITKADPGVVTAVNTFSDGEQVRIRDVVGMTDVNNKVFTVHAPTTTYFSLRDKLDTVDFDTTGYDVYVSGGTVEKVDNTFSGLGHLEGETVSVLGDGSVHADVVVNSGSITLTDYFNKVHAGLPYTSKLMPMKLAVPGANIRGKKKRIHQIVFSFYKTLGAKFETIEGSEVIPFRKTIDPMGYAPPLFTGEKIQTFPGGYELNGDIYVEQTQPLPLTVRSITARLQVYG